MKKALLSFLIFSLFAEEPEKIATLEASSYWKYHHLASIGYRRDRQKFTAPTTQIQIQNRNSMQLILGSHVEFHEIVFHIRGNYGWLINGDFDYSTPPYTFASADLGAGYTADALAALGGRCKFYDKAHFGFCFIPSIGYKYSHLMNFPQGEVQSGLATARFPKPDQQDWFGPYLEGRLEFRFWQVCEWNLFYQYHWPTMRSKSKEEIDLFMTGGEVTRFSSIYQAANMTKQAGGTDFKYHAAASGWNFGLHFEGSSAWSDRGRYKAKKTQIFPAGSAPQYVDEPASIRWVCYEVSTSLGYQF